MREHIARRRRSNISAQARDSTAAVAAGLEALACENLPKWTGRQDVFSERKGEQGPTDWMRD